MRTQRKTAKNGYAILELLFYISFFAVLALAVIEAMIAMAGSFRETAVYGDITQSAYIMERIGREIRGAYGINSIAATDLKLNTKDDTGADKTVEFLLNGGNVELLENNISKGNLNSSDIAVNNLSFTQVTTAAGVAVRFSVSLSSANDKLDRTFDFYDTVVLRGAY